MTAKPFFTEETLRFFRGLRRNNRREWFEERRGVFESAVKAPMLALIERLNAGMADYAPAHIRPATKILFRIYRDTRFSADKSPYKAHLGAWWARVGMEKTSGAGYYMHISATELVIAAGAYMPEKEQTLAIRRHLLANPEDWKKLIRDRGLLRAFDVHDPAALSRPPKGFPPDHSAIEWIKWRQWGVTKHLPPENILRAGLPEFIEQRFRLATPLVDFLNAPLNQPERSRRVLVSALPRK